MLTILLTSNEPSTTLSDGEFHKNYQVVPSRIFSRGEESIQGRELGVMFQDLRVVGVGARASWQPTIGSLFNPAAILRNISKMRNPVTRDILSGFEGVVAPGEMLRQSLFH